MEKFIKDLVTDILNYGMTRSDMQGIVSAKCMETGENENEILELLDNELAKYGMGV